MKDPRAKAIAAWVEMDVHQRQRFIIELCEDGGTDMLKALFMAIHDDEPSAKMFDQLTLTIATSIQLKREKNGS